MTGGKLGKRLLSLQEAADEKGVSRVAIHYAIKRGDLKATRVGNSWVIREEDLEEYTPRRKR